MPILDHQPAMSIVSLVLVSLATAGALRVPRNAAPLFRPTYFRKHAALFKKKSMHSDAQAVSNCNDFELISEALSGVIVPTGPTAVPEVPAKRIDMLSLGSVSVAAGVVVAAAVSFNPLLFANLASGMAADGGAIVAQMAYEVAHCTHSPAKLFGFIGACCNWFLGLSAVYDASRLGPEVISLPMTLVMLAYSIIFCRWAGWAVMPRNFILAGSHMLNIAAQSNQPRRCLAYKLETQPDARAEIIALGTKAAGALASVAAFVSFAPALKAMMPAGSYLASNGGPFTIHPWPPVTKFFLSLQNLADLKRPVEKISLTQCARLPVCPLARVAPRALARVPSLPPSPWPYSNAPTVAARTQVLRAHAHWLDLFVLRRLRHAHQLCTDPSQHPALWELRLAPRA